MKSPSDASFFANIILKLQVLWQDISIPFAFSYYCKHFLSTRCGIIISVSTPIFRRRHRHRLSYVLLFSMVKDLAM